MRRIAQILLMATMAIVAFTSVLLSTHFGQKSLLRFAAAMSSSENNVIAIVDLQGSLFGEGAIADVSISDSKGPWLTIHGIAFAWEPSELLSGRLAMSYVHVDRVSMLRKPVVADQETKPKASGFGLPLKIAIADLDVKAIEIAEQVAGERTKLRVTAEADIGDKKSANTAEIHLIRLDGPQSELRANFAFDPAKRSLDVAIDGNEAEGGIVSRLLDLPSRPPLSVKVHGTGALNAWKADLSLAASGKPFVAGTVRLDAAGNDTHRLSGHIAGFVERLVPRSIAGIFAGKTEVNLAATIAGLDDGAPRSISDMRFDTTGGVMRMTATGGVDLATGFIHGAIEGHAERDDGKSLTFADETSAPVSVQKIIFQASAPDSHDPRQITATARFDGIRHQKFTAAALTLAAHAAQPDSDGRRASVLEDINISLAASGVDETTALGKALGEEPHATLLGTYNGNLLSISALDIDTAGANAKVSGVMGGDQLKGVAHIDVSDLSRYAAIADHPLKGQATFDAKVDGSLETRAITASISGDSTGVATGIDALDGLLASATTYRATIERAADGTLSARDTSISNDLIVATLSGSRPQGSLALSGNVALASLAAINPQLAGKARLDVEIAGSDDDLRSNVALSGNGVRLNGKKLEGPRLSFTGRGPLSRHAGQFAMNGAISGEPLTGAAALVLSDTGTISIDDLTMEIAGAKLDGHVAVANAALPLPSGRIKIDAPNLARLGHAIGTRLKGRIAADVALSGDGSNGVAKLNIEADDIAVGDLRIKSVRSVGNVSNYLESPAGSVGVKIAGIVQGAKPLGGLSLDARFKDGGATVTSKGRIDGGALELSANARTIENVRQIEIKSASYTGRSDLPPIRIATPASLSLQDGKVATEGLRIAIGEGALRIAGSANSNVLDLDINLNRIPATITAIAAPELGIQGSIDGTANIKGKPSDPKITAKIAATGLSLKDTRSRQLPEADITTDVSAADGKAQVNVHATARDGTDLAISGTVGLKDDGALALSGRGTVPLTLANVFLADRATRLGAATLTAEISGKVSKPRVDGRVLVDGATVSDSDVGLELSDIDADVGFTQDRVTVRKLIAVSKKGGNASAEGSIALPPDGDPTVDVALKLAAFKFGNQEPIAGQIDGNVKVTGPIQALVARGDVLIDRMDITVPSGMPQSVSSLHIRHVNAPAEFQSADDETKKPEAQASSGPSISLVLDVRANDRIFVRGRGVDAQLGGYVKIRGTAEKPFTDGQFTMSRGKLSIIGRQLDFSRGNIVFMGSLEPSLDMAAEADADGTTVTVKVTGPASKPKFQFTSTPELPEDEIVSLLLFNKKLAKLSPSQLVQLAGEIDKIGGLSSGPGTLDKMKSALGIDVLDVTTDDKGNAQATAGSYINDSTYVGVQQGTSLGKSRVVVDHDLTKTLKARGEVGTDGDSKLGLGFEWDY